MIEELFPRHTSVRMFLTHTPAEPFIGTVRQLLRDPVQAPVLGYINYGGTLDELAMLFADKCTWPHVVAAAAVGRGDRSEVLLNQNELGAILGNAEPFAIYHRVLRHVE